MPWRITSRVVDGRTLYANTTGQVKEVEIDGVLTGKRWSGVLRLALLGVDLLEK